MSACSRAERVGAEAAACGARPGRWPPGRRRGGARREECRALPASAESPAPGLIMENPPVIFYPFSCWSVPPGPASAPPERDDFVFELFPAAPWPGPGRCGVAARCRCPQGSVRRRQGLFRCLPVGLPEAQRAGMPPARPAAWSVPLRRGARRDSLGRGQWDSEAPSGHHPPGVSLAQPFPAPRRPSLPLSLDGPPGPLVLGALRAQVVELRALLLKWGPAPAARATGWAQPLPAGDAGGWDCHCRPSGARVTGTGRLGWQGRGSRGVSGWCYDQMDPPATLEAPV